MEEAAWETEQLGRAGCKSPNTLQWVLQPRPSCGSLSHAGNLQQRQIWTYLRSRFNLVNRTQEKRLKKRTQDGHDCNCQALQISQCGRGERPQKAEPQDKHRHSSDGNQVLKGRCWRSRRMQRTQGLHRPRDA